MLEKAWAKSVLTCSIFDSASVIRKTIEFWHCVAFSKLF